MECILKGGTTSDKTWLRRENLEDSAQDVFESPSHSELLAEGSVEVLGELRYIVLNWAMM